MKNLSELTQWVLNVRNSTPVEIRNIGISLFEKNYNNIFKEARSQGLIVRNTFEDFIFVVVIHDILIRIKKDY